MTQFHEGQEVEVNYCSGWRRAIITDLPAQRRDGFYGNEFTESELRCSAASSARTASALAPRGWDKTEA